MTEYLVLLSDPDGSPSWIQFATVEARSATSAIRQAIDGANGKGGIFVAVPARSWKPVTVKVETKTALKFS